MLTDNQIARLLDIANAGCHKGAVLEARAVYEGVLAVKPGHVPALIGQAISRMVVGEYDAAEEQLRAVLDANPDDCDAIAALGLCLTLAGKAEEAAAALEKAAAAESPAADLARRLLEQAG